MGKVQVKGEGYEFRLLDLTDDDLRRSSELLRSIFGKRGRHLTERYLRWFYVDNPEGRAIAFNAYKGTELAAHGAGVPMRGLVRGQPVTGLVFVNAVVAVGHRGRGVQGTVCDHTMAEAARRGHSFCFVAGNKQSTKRLVTRFKPIAPLEALPPAA